ncbi:hypothetical protein CLV30_12829 [Haloactinopolyspora alba]|uniref:Uncharacterized protein n=1 Tax=Haloactinopolyspora alba TaxID=648780 RepID=A0A2P8DF10_9ACTN|nr:hypothetical protein [Haloactinopolyspora alba]PSK95777.1 hypothetical protein CLV30_12829 [Haloactinopolyspora alba]
MYTYRNRNTDDVVSYQKPSARLDRLPNWDRIEADPEPEERAADQPDSESTTGEPDGLFDPAEHNVDDVNEYLANTENPDEVTRVLEAEAEGKNRSSIVTGPHSTQS